MLSYPFAIQSQQTIVGENQAPLQRGNHIAPPKGASTSKEMQVYMVASKDVSIQTRKRNDNQEKGPKRNEPVVLETTPLHIEEPSYDVSL